MNYTVVHFSREELYIQKFLKLPRRLYSRRESMQQPAEERKLLTGTHILSHTFTFLPLLVLDEQENAVGRAALTVYPGDPDACLGFFECEEIEEAACLLLKKAESLARKFHCTRILGPIDASFWIRYRFKANQFAHSYTGEPYNKSYYPKLWLAHGYRIFEHYYSNHYTVIPVSHSNPQFSERLAEKASAGYVIKSPSRADFDRTLREVYGLLIELYKDFPAYRRITEAEFISLYGYLKALIRYPMVKMAYHQGQPVGFFISIPDYGHRVYGSLTLLDVLRILFTRMRPRSYVMLYMGVDPAHRGLGKALAESIKEELQIAGVPSVGALIRRGNVNKDYFQELVDYEYEYLLLEKKLS